MPRRACAGSSASTSAVAQTPNVPASDGAVGVATPGYCGTSEPSTLTPVLADYRHSARWAVSTSSSTGDGVVPDLDDVDELDGLEL